MEEDKIKMVKKKKKGKKGKKKNGLESAAASVPSSLFKS